MCSSWTISRISLIWAASPKLIEESSFWDNIRFRSCLMGCWETPVFNSSQVAWNLNLKFHSTGAVVYGSRVLPDNQAPSNRGWAELEFFATEWVAWWEKCQGTPFYILPMYLLRGARVVLIQWYHTRWGIWITNKWYTFIQLSLCQIQSCPLFYCPKKLSSRSISNCNSNVFTMYCSSRK